jgi:hypothetical protein
MIREPQLRSERRRTFEPQTAKPPWTIEDVDLCDSSKSSLRSAPTIKRYAFFAVDSRPHMESGWRDPFAGVQRRGCGLYRVPRRPCYSGCASRVGPSPKLPELHLGHSAPSCASLCLEDELIAARDPSP